jgi:hypothetical protein
MQQKPKPRAFCAEGIIRVLDSIEAGTVAQMARRRGLDEAAMRKLIHEDAETRASYERKNARAVVAVRVVLL